MTRTFTTSCAAVMLALGISLAAQSTRQVPQTDTPITLTGCLEKNKSGGYWLTSAMPPAVPSARTGVVGIQTPNTITSPSRIWNLEHGLRDLDKYVGQRVEIVGRPKETTSSDQLKGAGAVGEIEVRDLNVDSVKMVAISCS